MNQEELIELLKPCAKLCLKCGAKCCYDKKTGEACKGLKDGQCTQRKEYCLLIYCNKMERYYPKIVKKLKEELRHRYPMAIKRGITPNYKWETL